MDERLHLYGLAGKVADLQDLVVSEGEHLRVSGRADQSRTFGGVMHRIPVKTIGDLKRLIGVPDAVVQQQCECRFGAQLDQTISPAFTDISQLSREQMAILRTASREYLYGNSAAVSHYEAALDTALGLAARNIIAIILYQDITVEQDAVLEVDSSVDCLFARNVLVKLRGRIHLNGALKMDVSSFEGQEPPYIYVGSAVGMGQALRARVGGA